MASEDRSTAAGAVNPPPSNDSTYTSRGVFNNTGTSAGTTGTSGSSTSQTTLNPSTGTGGGGNANDATITLSAGSGLTGGGDFTTNQADAETITFTLGNVITAQTFGDTTNGIQTLTVDSHGRVTSATTASGPGPAPDPFNDNLQTTAMFAGGPVPARTGGVEEPTQVTAQVTVDSSDYTITNIEATGNNVSIISAEVDPTDDSIANVVGTIPANTAGPVSITTEATVRRDSTGDVETQTRTPLSTTLYVPYYRFGPTDMDLDFSNPVDISAWAEAGTDEIRSGTMINFERTAGATQQIYWALEQVPGRNYMIDVGFGVFDFVSGDTLTTATRLGRTFNVYKFFSRATQAITINF